MLPSGAGARVRGAGTAGRRCARRAEPRARPARRGGRRGRPRCSSTSRRSPRAAGSRARPASSPRWSCRSPACTGCARRCSAASATCPDPQQQRPEHRVRAQRGPAAGSLPGRAGRAERCSPRWPRSSRCCASSTTRSGSIACRRRRWRSSPAGCSPSGSGWCSPCATTARSDELRGPAGAGDRRARRRRCGRRCSTPRSPVRSTSGCATRILAEAAGNPLALLELPRGMAVAGGYGLPGTMTADQPHGAGLHAAARSRCRPRPGACCCSRRPSRSAT